MSLFFCNNCFNLITKREAQSVPLLPISFDKGQSIVDPDLFKEASVYTGCHVEIIPKEALQVLKSPHGKVSNYKVAATTNSNINEDDKDNDSDDR